MIKIQNLIRHFLIFSFIFSLIAFSGFHRLSAHEINWIEVANVNSEKQFIDTNSIKYNKGGWLSVVIKYSEVNPEDQEIINTNSYLMAIDCKNRLFSKLPINSELKQVKNWTKPINNKLIKKTILNSCSY
tara:strand:- start:113 stop:502 length:390 start_codon:yes stop_codon:yes gene_type:complete